MKTYECIAHSGNTSLGQPNACGSNGTMTVANMSIIDTDTLLFSTTAIVKS